MSNFEAVQIAISEKRTFVFFDKHGVVGYTTRPVDGYCMCAMNFMNTTAFASTFRAEGRQ